ncbi:MAG: lycopene cyclase domain-containing protein [Ktedonobacterales bacterium]
MSHWSYLPFLLAWALPIVAIEWLLGGRYLWRERRLWPWVVLGLGIYFSLADAVAIAAGIWRFDAHFLVGVTIGPVPLEEVLFYLLTAAMVVQGFVVFWYGARDSWRLLTLPGRVKRRLAPPGRRDFSPSPLPHSTPAGTPDV